MKSLETLRHELSEAEAEYRARAAELHVLKRKLYDIKHGVRRER